MSVEVIHGDCREVLATMESDSFDTCVCDPPYGLEFMSVAWDTFAKPKGAARVPNEWNDHGSREHPRDARGQARVQRNKGLAFQRFCDEWAREVYRVLKPGAHLLAFGGTRTYHRLACAIEDAGFEIRDTIMWLYGSGFPKSHDVSKAIDRAAGAEREVVGRRTDRAAMPKQNFRGGQHHAGGGINGAYDGSAITAPATEAARQWQGWGTSLKPAVEPIVVARKPLSESTIAANVLRWETGAINVDVCRVGSPEGKRAAGTRLYAAGRLVGGTNGLGVLQDAPHDGRGRWPANVCHDGSPEVMRAFSKFGERTTNSGTYHKDSVAGMYSPVRQNGTTVSEGDTGTAARFFFCAKADASERVGSHPTVKPVALMEWLVTLVTPPGGRVLDPFCGTGSTLVACDRLGFDAIGIEQDAQSVNDAREKILRMRARRLLGDDVKLVEHAPGQLGLAL